eukprot:GHVR01186899.1.p1 GENE.GHVR01186899.1~~GHVR01186899.1.p1  ORF type:complete len:115 (-),score=18.88 GHVR01186899.1:289-633(-)
MSGLPLEPQRDLPKPGTRLQFYFYTHPEVRTRVGTLDLTSGLLAQAHTRARTQADLRPSHSHAAFSTRAGECWQLCTSLNSNMPAHPVISESIEARPWTGRRWIHMKIMYVTYG